MWPFSGWIVNKKLSIHFGEDKRKHATFRRMSYIPKLNVIYEEKMYQHIICIHMCIY